MTPARNPDLTTITGFISNNVLWRDCIYVAQNGGPAELDDIEWIFQLRRCAGSDTPDLQLSTAGTGLQVATLQNDGQDVDVLQFDGVDVTSYCGDYFADFLCKDLNGVVTHLASGVVTFINAPGQI